jgi:hypothetical protein
MSFLFWFKKKEQEVEDVVQEVTSIVSGPIMKELMVVADKVLENGNNPIVVAALAEMGINAVEIALAMRAFEVIKTLITKVEVAVQAQAAEQNERQVTNT